MRFRIHNIRLQLDTAVLTINLTDAVRGATFEAVATECNKVDNRIILQPEGELQCPLLTICSNISGIAQVLVNATYGTRYALRNANGGKLCDG